MMPFCKLTYFHNFLYLFYVDYSLYDKILKSLKKLEITMEDGPFNNPLNIKYKQFFFLVFLCIYLHAVCCHYINTSFLMTQFFKPITA